MKITTPFMEIFRKDLSQNMGSMDKVNNTTRKQIGSIQSGDIPQECCMDFFNNSMAVTIFRYAQEL